MRDIRAPVQGRPRDPGHRPLRIPRLHAEPGGPGRPVERPGLRIRQCAELGKPLFVGETGIRPIDAGGTLEDRAGALQTKVELRLGRGVYGVVAWNWSPLGSTLDDYDIGPGDPALAALQEAAPSYWSNASTTPTTASAPEPLQPAGGDQPVQHEWVHVQRHPVRHRRPCAARDQADHAAPRDHLATSSSTGRRSPTSRGGADVVLSGGRRPGDRWAHVRRGPLGDPRPRDQWLRRGGHPIARSEGLITGNVIGTSPDRSSAVRHPSGTRRRRDPDRERHRE